MTAEDALAWVRTQCDAFAFDVSGIFSRNGEHAWPFDAADPEDLEAKLLAGGHLLPLPREPAALANVLEVATVDHLVASAAGRPDVAVTRGSERGYPDVELNGPLVGSAPVAVDVKVARRADNGVRTRSRMTLYTGNTYFRWPQLHWPGTLRPFNEYAEHLDLVVIYTFVPDIACRVADLELIVQPAWRIASRQRSSTTREYIGAIDVINDLRQGRGEFAAPEEFYTYWRSFPFRISQQVQRQLDRLIRQQEARIAELERRGGGP